MTAWSCTIRHEDAVTGRLWDHDCGLAITGTADGRRIYLTATLTDPAVGAFPSDFYAALAAPGAFLTGFIDRDGKRWAGELALGTKWRMQLTGSSHVDGVIGMRGEVRRTTEGDARNVPVPSDQATSVR